MSGTIRHGDTGNTENLNKDLRASVSYHPRRGPWLGRIALWLLPLLFLLIAFFYPLSRILLLTFRVLVFTFYQAILSTLLTLLLGLPSAYLFARYDFRGKSLLRALTAVPFMLPT